MIRLQNILKILLILVVSWNSSIHALEFRSINPIRAPEGNEILHSRALTRLCADVNCDELIHAEKIVPVKKNHVEKIIKKLAKDWKTRRLSEYLAEDFFEKERLLDTLRASTSLAPKLRILAIRDLETISQFVKPVSIERAGYRFSLMVAKIKTQVEYNTAKGYVKSKANTQEYLFLIREKLKNINP